MSLRYTNRMIKVGLERVIDDIMELPNGYKFWMSFNQTRRDNLINKWRKIIFSNLFPFHVRIFLLKSILNEDGTYEDQDIFKWLKDVVYGGKERAIYYEWYKFVVSKRDKIPA